MNLNKNFDFMLSKLSLIILVISSCYYTNQDKIVLKLAQVLKTTKNIYFVSFKIFLNFFINFFLIKQKRFLFADILFQFFLAEIRNFSK